MATENRSPFPPPSPRHAINDQGAYTIEIFDPPIDRCPYCGVFALCLLPPKLLAAQPDATNVVCHPGHGGCNQGFEMEEENPNDAESARRDRGLPARDGTGS